MTKLNAVRTLWSRRKLASSLGAIIILFVVWFQVTPLFNSGFFDEQGNLLFDSGAPFVDASVHLSLVGEMLYRFPPTNFAYGGAPLKNYHFFYDVLLALVVKVAHISVLDLYFRIAPVVLSLSLTSLVFFATFRLTKNYLTSILSIFFTVMATSFGQITPMIKTLLHANPVNGANNIFMTDQIYDMIVNPQGVLSLVIFLSLFICAGYYTETKRIRFLIIFSLLLGVSFGVKAYGGIVFCGGSIIYGLWSFITKKDLKPLLATMGGLAMVFVWVDRTIDGRVVGLSFQPFWLLGRMMEDLDRLNEPGFSLIRDNYLVINGWRQLGILYGKSFIYYLVGSLGLRILGFGPFIQYLRRLKTVSVDVIFLLATGGISFLIPIFFNQGRKAYDIVQFTPYFTLVMGLFSSIAIAALGQRFKLKPARALILTVFSCAYLLLLNREISSRVRISDYQVPVTATGIGEVRGSKIAIVKPVLDAADYILLKTDPSAIFLLAPSRANLNSLWFSALARRRTAYSGEFFNYQLGNDTGYVNKIKQSFAGTGTVTYDYIFLRRSEMSEFGRIESGTAKKIFENKEVVIFQKV